ncbi:MAG TPA: hypothetical protein VII11_01800, partial [Bacteroidota bacterium]
MKIPSTVAIILLFACNSYAQFAADLRIIREDAQSAVIEFVPDFLGSFSADGEVVSDVQGTFYGFLVEHARPGDPIILYRAASVLLPSQRYSLQVVAAEYREVSGVRPRVAPRLQTDELGFVEIPQDAAASFSQQALKREVVELVDISREQSGFIGTLRFYPVHYGANGSLARIYTRIVVKIDIDSRQRGMSLDPLDAKTQKLLHAGRNTVGAVLTDSPLAQGEWYRLDVKETGIYKLDRDFFSRNSITLTQSLNIHSLRVYGNDGTELPENVAAPRPNGLEEMPRYIVDRNGNGQFDNDDFVLFYGKSTRGWNYDPQQKTYNHYINHYTETNSYFLTFGGGPGRVMDSVASTNIPGAYAPPDFLEKHFVEEELFNHGQNGVSSGRQWLGRSFDEATRSQTYTTSLSGIVAEKPVVYRYVLLSRSTTTDAFTIFENNQQLGNKVFTFPIDVTAIDNEKYYRTPVITASRTGEYPEERSV